MEKNIVIIENHIISTNTVRQKLTQELMTQGYHVTVLSTGSEKELATARRKGFNVVDVGTSNTKILDVVRYVRKLYKEIKKADADICLTFTIRPAIWGNIVTRLLRVPTITNITGIGPLAKSNSLIYKIARILYRLVLKKTALVFFQNKDDLSIFLSKKFVKPNQTQVIPGSGIDYEYFKPIPRAEHEEGFVFLFIGRLIKDKGILEYVEAAKSLKENYPNMSCKILGPYYSQNLKENIITEKQILHWLDDGIVNHLGAADDVRPYIAEADCIILPSYREGMSNVLLEAGSMEKPCIASDTTGCNDIIIDHYNGFLCKVKNATDLALKMQSMMTLSEEERKQMGINARERVIQKFAKKIVLDAYLDAISKLMKA
ncbi:MAG: glycosyltransferase family 4 protein [Ferruginibacter sp.]